jgi:cytidylate kinase
MPAKTVTFSVQIGSSGFTIARAVAERLHYKYYDWEITSQAANEAGVSPETIAASEIIPSRAKRIVERFLAASVFSSDETGIDPEPSAATMDTAIRALSSDHYRNFIERVVLELSDRGESVIVGHAGQVTLQKEPGVLKVLVCGSQGRRALRLASEENLTADAALAEVQRSDRDRIGFFRHVYHVELLDAALYDLTVNTDVMPIETAIELVVAAAMAMPGLAPERQPAETADQSETATA